MNRIFIDMDGVIVDFEAKMRRLNLTSDDLKKQQGAYLDLDFIPGAKEAIHSLIGMGFEVWLATKPPTGVSFAYADKAQWVFNNLPELKRRIIITHDKGLLGDHDDYLIDDRIYKANCNAFLGTLIEFSAHRCWAALVPFFKDEAKKYRLRPKTA